MRVGVIAADRRPAAWKVEAVERILALDQVELGCFVEASTAPARGPLSRVVSTWKRALVPALRPTDLPPLPSGSGDADKVDFVIDLREPDERTPTLPEGFPHGPRLGVWSVAFDDPFVGRARGRPETARFRLEARMSDGSRSVALEEGHARFLPWAYGRTLEAAHRLAARLPARFCAILQAREPSDGGGLPRGDVPRAREVDRAGGPSFGAFVWAMSRVLWEKVRRAVRFVFRSEEWTLGLSERPIQALLDGEGLGRYQLVPPLGRGRYLADPFGIPGGEGIRVLCEGYDYARRLGWLAELTLTPDGRVLHPARPASLRFPHHVSFPYLFEHDGHWYCLPETYQAGSVTLWRTDPAFTEWNRVGTVLEGVPLLDPVVIHHRGRWWLFGTLHQGWDTMSTLSLWYADDFRGPWQAHPQNPVKVDVRSARCAGTPFRHEGALYRPAQDCSGSYGSGIVIHRIDHLSPHHFAETAVARVDPDRAGDFPDGIHTISAVGGRVLFDLKRHSFVPVAAAADIRERIMRRLRRRSAGSASGSDPAGDRRTGP